MSNAMSLQGAITADAIEIHDHDYTAMLDRVQQSFGDCTNGQTVLFQTDATGLWDAYLGAFPPSHRQLHNCHACRRFIETYGGVVSIDEHGDTYPVMWYNGDEGGDFYAPVFNHLDWIVAKAKVVSPFFTDKIVWGEPGAGEYRHLSVKPNKAFVHRDRLLTPFQATAVAKEDYRIVLAGLADFSAATIDDALRLLNAETLRQSEKFVAPLQWLRKLHDRPKGRAGANLLWRAVATAPKGFLHPRSAVTGTLLEDIAAGLSFDTIKRRFDDKLAPLKYQRPQAAPTSGNIKRAEEIIAKIGLEPSLHRRFAQIEDVTSIWKPKSAPKATTSGGVFGHLTPKGSEPKFTLSLPKQIMTWDKFSRKVLPTAEKIELYLPSHSGSYIALVTAANADAPPILMWDAEEERNPVSWYVYPTGSPAAQWGLRGGTWVPVTAVTQYPNQWGSRPLPELADGAILLLEGAVDSRLNAGNALFPGMLKNQLREVRSTIEAYSKSAKFTGQDEASACGFSIRKGANEQALVRVLTGGAWTDYGIDRWD